MFLNYCQPYDLAVKIYRQHRFWFHGPPKIKLSGEVGQFGVLLFDFFDNVVTARVYIKDREFILNAAHMAIANFIPLTNEYIERKS